MSVNVMVLDDELIILDGMSSFPWERYGCRLVATAQNGQEGLEKMEEFQPDLVFTDIRMPKMDGISFAAEARKIKKNVRIVFLTGYDSFEYAQEAIRVGGSDYLLKPMNFRKLDELLQRLCGEINKENEVDSYYRDLKKTFEKEIPYIRSKLVSDLLHGRIRDRHDLERQLDAVNLKIAKYICVAITRENAHAQKDNSWPEQFAFLNIGDEIFGEHCRNVLCEYDDMNLQFGFILLFDTEDLDQYCMEQATAGAEKLQKVARELIRYNICIGLSSVCVENDRVHEAYLEACHACSQSIYLGENTIVHYNDLDDVLWQNYEITDGQKQRLLMKIYSGQTAETEKEIREMFSEAGDNLENCKYMAMDLMVACMKYPFLCRVKCAIQEKEYDFSFLQDGIKVIGSAESVEEIVQYLTRSFSLLTRQNHQDTEERYQHVVKQITEYLNEHYMENLTLDSIADEFHMSRTYVSRLLRRYAGKSFLKILVDIRMEEARKMILEEKYKMYEIAERVGYNDFSYFIQAFKKKYGVTPNEYRHSV